MKKGIMVAIVIIVLIILGSFIYFNGNNSGQDSTSGTREDVYDQEAKNLENSEDDFQAIDEALELLP